MSSLWERTVGAHLPNQLSQAASKKHEPKTLMELITLLPLAAIGWSFLYMILGGGLLGAAVIFIVAKMLGK